ncbi:aspartyl aminopeptidase-like isoform X2 [Watersipora subatra]|uniref:aspartyl aminopeptidase-like isoform X1 n=1 Tax=Watersipora subatra TaxID=2589382 RepID=UPI00355BDC5B
MGEMAGRQWSSNAAQGMIDFINRSPSPWHAVSECKRRLVAAGFQELKEADRWEIQPKSKYFVTRNMSTIISFVVGGTYKPGNGFSIIGAHTDSPCLRVKPISKKKNAGYIQVGVEQYGGGNWLTWFDRDLKLAGRVMVKSQGKIQSRLVDINRPLLRVPHLAIHLQRDVNSKFSPNLESEILPVLATAVQEKLNPTEKIQSGPQTDKHHPALLSLIAKELQVEVEEITDMELCLADYQPSVLGGVYEEFVFAPRLDNLLNVYASLEAIISTCDNEIASEPCIRVASFFDHEEVGSASAQGASSSLQRFILERLSASSEDPEAYHRCIPQSFVISADQAHAVHPNYKSKHEENHSVEMHKGIVMKFNCKQRYATNAWTSTVLREVASLASVPLQEIVVRNDSTCGSTIGPLIATKLAIPTIDLGGPQLSMHSIREQCCTSSVAQAIALYESFYTNFPKIRAMVEVD